MNPNPASSPRRVRGFTLLDSMAALAVAGVVMSAALPSLQSQVRQSRRVDGMQALAAVQLAQERWRAEHPGYATDLAVLGMPERSAGRHYVLSIAAAGPAGYTLRATADSAAQQHDTACRTLTLALVGGQVVHGALDATGVADFDNARRCWVL